MSRKSFRIECAVERIKQLRPNCSMRFLTLTTPDVVTPYEISKRWRMLCNSRFWRGLNLLYVQVVEWHPGGHGYHIHVVVDKYINVRELRRYTTACGFGRIHIIRCDDNKVQKLAFYMAKYLSKYRDAVPRGTRVRFTNVSRGLTTLVDIQFTDPCNDFAKSVLSDCREDKLFDGLLVPSLYSCASHVYISYPFHSVDYFAEFGLPMKTWKPFIVHCLKNFKKIGKAPLQPFGDMLNFRPVGASAI